MLDDDFLIWSQRHQCERFYCKDFTWRSFQKIVNKNVFIRFRFKVKLNFEQKFIYIGFDLAWIRLTNTTQ